MRCVDCRVVEARVALMLVEEWPRQMTLQKKQRVLRFQFCNWDTVFIPIFARRLVRDGPTPLIFRTGSGAKIEVDSLLPIIEKPLGLSKSEASLAKNLLEASPIDAVIPKVFSRLFARFIRAWAGLSPEHLSSSLRSR